MKKLLLFAIVILGFSAVSFGQGATEDANASATIITPITITKVLDMEFGNVSVSAGTGGTIVLGTDDSRTETDGATAIASVTGTVNAAEFTIEGAEDYTYAITLPASVVISNGANSMTVNAFTSTPDGTGTLTGGSETLKVGATLNVGAGQAPGIYTSTTPFEVTVDYN